jgi:hypothetical protein
MDVDNMFNDNEKKDVCIGYNFYRPKYSEEFRNLKNYYDCKRKVDEIKNGLFNSKYDKQEMIEILKSTILQIEDER